MIMQYGGIGTPSDVGPGSLAARSCLHVVQPAVRDHFLARRRSDVEGDGRFRRRMVECGIQ